MTLTTNNEISREVTQVIKIVQKKSLSVLNKYLIVL